MMRQRERNTTATGVRSAIGCPIGVCIVVDRGVDSGVPAKTQLFQELRDTHPSKEAKAPASFGIPALAAPVYLPKSSVRRPPHSVATPKRPTGCPGDGSENRPPILRLRLGSPVH